MTSQPSLFDRPPSRPLLDLAALCSPEEIAVANQLRRGRANARKVDEIATDASLALRHALSGRRTQAIIRHLIEQHHVPVGTSMSEPYGNYLIEDQAELDATADLLHLRGVQHLMREAALRRIPVRELLARVQTELDAA